MAKLSIVENSVEFSCQISAAEAVKLINQLSTQILTGSSKVSESPKEDLPQPLRNPEKIVVVAERLSQQGKTVFEKSDIVKAFEAASFVIPKNLSRDMAWAESSGWIAKSSQTESGWYLTETGRALVAQGFPATIRNKTRARRQGVRKVQY